MRAKEVVVAKRANRRGQLSGDIEGDEHSIRSFHVAKVIVFVTAQLKVDICVGLCAGCEWLPPRIRATVGMLPSALVVWLNHQASRGS